MPLRRQAATGVAWSGAASALTMGLGFLQLAVLTHLLSPEDFGLMAMVMVVLEFAHAFGDMGISNAVIHRQQVEGDRLSSLFWVNVLAGVAIFATLLAVSPVVAAGFGEPRLTGLTTLAAVVFLIAPTGQLFSALLQKELEFKSLGMVEISSTVIGTTVAIGCASAGYGVHSLIAGYLAAATVRAMLLFTWGTNRWRPHFRLRSADLEGFVGFGLYQMGERSINYFNSRLDQVLIGALLGAQALGYYNLAVQIVMQPVWRINPIVTRVAFPVFSRIQTDKEALSRGYHFILRVLSLTNFPLLAGMAVLSPWLVPLCFGSEWQPAVVLIQGLSVVAMIRTTGNPVGALLLARGRADWGFFWNGSLLLVQVPAICLGEYLGGVMGVVWALVITQIVYFVANYRLLVRGLLGPCLTDYLMTMAPALGLSLATGAVVAWFLEWTGHPSIPGLAAAAGIGAALYFGLCLAFQRRHLVEIRDFAWKH